MRLIVQPKSNDGRGALGEILTCSAENSVGKGKPLGMSAVRWAILSAAGLDGGMEGRSEEVSLSELKTTTAQPP